MKRGDEAAAARRQLELILASPGFVRSERMCRFLRFTVEEALRGGSPASLKEAVIAVHVFDRGTDFNPAADPVVRVEARRLRTKLKEYYAGPGADDPVVITLPKGGYCPLFQSSAEEPAQSVTIKRWRSGRAVAIAAVVLAAVGLLGGLKGLGVSRRSVAVLPMLDLSDEGTLGNFSDGLTEQLIVTLCRIDGLRVPGRTSSFRFKGSTLDAKGIGSQLGVDHILDSSVRTAGERLRISAQLVDVRDGATVWGQTYDRRLGDTFAVQDEISRAVANALRLRVAPQVRVAATESEVALRFYLEGRRQWHENAFAKAIEAFRSAIAADPGFALAYAGMARSYGRIEGDPESLMRAEDAAQRALEIDETLSDAVIVLAINRLRQRDWKGAERNFLRAIRLNPRSAEAHGEYAIGYLASHGRIEEALRESRKAIEAEPLSSIDHIRHGVLLMYARQFEHAERQLRRASVLGPEYARRHLGRLYLLTGRYQEALDHFVAEPGWRAVTLAKMGRLDEVLESPPQDDLTAAIFWAAAGNRDRAFEALDRSYRANGLGLTSLMCSPFWDPLRGDARFRSMVSRIAIGL